MELRHLRYLVAVAEQKSFVRAANQCGVSQPALSQQLRVLEDELGVPLLHRHPRGVELTEAGRKFFERARNLVNEADALLESVRESVDQHEGTVTIGVIPTVAPYLLPQVLSRIRSEYPRIAVRIREGRTSELLENLVDGSIDFAITSDVGQREQKRWSLHIRNLFREPLMLALPERHPLANAGEMIPLSHVPESELIVLTEGHCLTDQVLKVCRTNRNPDRIECEELATAQALVKSGLGISLVPMMTARTSPLEGVVYRRLGPREPKRLIAVVHRRSQPMSPTAAAVLNCLRQLEVIRRGVG